MTQIQRRHADKVVFCIKKKQLSILHKRKKYNLKKTQCLIEKKSKVKARIKKQTENKMPQAQ